MKAPLRQLLDSLIDYAGLFPPAALSMKEAADYFATYLAGPHRELLGRFIVPAGRLQELEGVAHHHFAEGVWRVSALIGSDTSNDFRLIEEFNDRNARSAMVDAIEIKVARADHVHVISELAGEDAYEVFCEVTPDERAEELIDLICQTGLSAKIRTGGVTPEAFPTPETIARFMALCAERNVPFKATAGLHHPIRCTKPLTYEPDSVHGTMHGFLNVFLAATLIHSSGETAGAIELLGFANESTLEVDDAAITWGDHVLTVQQIAAARSLARSFGSCSFEEPLDDLSALGLLDRTI